MLRTFVVHLREKFLAKKGMGKSVLVWVALNKSHFLSVTCQHGIYFQAFSCQFPPVVSPLVEAVSFSVESVPPDIV